MLNFRNGFCIMLSFATHLAGLCSLLSSSGALAQEPDRQEDWREENKVAEGAEHNPPPPTADPKLRRLRAIPLPGGAAPRKESTGLYRQEKQELQRSRAPLWTDNQQPASTDNTPVDGGYTSMESRRPRRYETTKYPARNIYLNGVNISNVRQQTLENVTLEIDEEGNLKILAPQYEVGSNSTFHPLLPSELPKLQKSLPLHPSLPMGRYSKEGQPARRKQESQQSQKESGAEYRAESGPASGREPRASSKTERELEQELEQEPEDQLPESKLLNMDTEPSPSSAKPRRKLSVPTNEDKSMQSKANLQLEGAKSKEMQ